MKKPQVLAHPGLRGNVEIYEETNVMHDHSTTTAQVIPFRQKELLLVGNAGEPFVPMKPVVEGMGLAWQSQHRKLMAGRFASTITEMVIVAQGGKQREMTCLPLRKLTGWLMSIHPNKVRPALREGIIAYQNECDDVLWAYWNEGAAVRRDDRTAASVLATTIGTDGFHCLAAIVDGKVRHLPSAIRRGAKNHIWSQVHKAFSVVTAEDIPADQLDSARNFIAAYALEGEWLPRERVHGFGALIGRPLGRLERWMVSINYKGEEQYSPIPNDACVLSHRDLIKAMVATPGDLPVSTDEMFELAQAALMNLKSRATVQQHQLRQLRQRVRQ